MYANIFTRDKKAIAGKKRGVCKCDRVQQPNKKQPLKVVVFAHDKKPQPMGDKVEK